MVEVRKAFSEGAWIPWFLEWTPAEIGPYDLTVRTMDKNGTPQIQPSKEPFPDGATEYHRVTIEIIPE